MLCPDWDGTRLQADAQRLYIGRLAAIASASNGFLLCSVFGTDVQPTVIFVKVRIVGTTITVADAFDSAGDGSVLGNLGVRSEDCGNVDGT